MKKVIINQGVPGSGKSSYAGKCAQEWAMGMTWCSADAFHTNAKGEYNFDPSKIGEAHAACFRKFIAALATNEHTSRDALVVVDNTNIHVSEMSPYYLAAQAFGFDVEVQTFKVDPKVAHARNKHGVPLEVVERMAASMEEPLPFWDVTHVVNDEDGWEEEDAP